MSFSRGITTNNLLDFSASMSKLLAIIMLLTLTTTSMCQTYSFNKDMDYFSATYVEAYQKFKQVCQATSGYKYSEYELPSILGLQGEKLYMSACFHEERANMLKNMAESNVFLTFSGVHGQEGFAGSPIQIAMIKNDTKYQFNLPDNTYPVHIHMLNPYGASYATKENENNVDMLKNLNGHYIDSAGWEISKNVLLEEFIDNMNISHIHLDSVQAQAVAYFNNLLAKIGLTAFTQASVLGQIHRQIGIAYAGTTEEWTAKTVKSILNQLVKGYSSENTKSRKILYIDLHTAVGDYGNVYAMFDPEWISFAKQYLLKSEYIHNNLFPFPSGKYFGHFIKEFALMSESKANLTIVPTAWEIGTFPQDAYQNYFLMQVNCRFYQNVTDRSPQFCPFVNSKVGEYFYPQDINWKSWAFGNLTIAMRSSMNGMNQWIMDDSKWRVVSLANCNVWQSAMLIIFIICGIVVL